MATPPATGPARTAHRLAWFACAVLCAAMWAAAPPAIAQTTDPPECGGKPATIVGTDDSEELFGTSGRDVIWAGGGNDRVVAGSDYDIVCGGYGHDTLYGADFPDRLLGGPGNDKLVGGDAHDYLHGGPGVDTFDGQGALDKISWLGSGPVTVNGANGYADTADGRESITSIGWLIGSELGDVMRHNQGKVSGGAGNDTLHADRFGMTLWGNAGNDQMSGPSGSSKCTSAPSSLRACFKMYGGSGADTMTASSANDYLTGEAGADTIDGAAGNDNLSGGNDDDTLIGGAGDDRFVGGRGADTMRGLGGIDGWAPASPSDFGYARDVADAGGDSFDGGDGPDWVDFITGYGYSNLTVNLAEGVISAHNSTDTPYTATLTDVRSVRGGYADDETLIGNSLANVLLGMDGTDTILGGGDDDLLSGGDGIDAGAGGSGSDTCRAFEDTQGCESTAAFTIPHALPWWW